MRLQNLKSRQNPKTSNNEQQRSFQMQVIPVIDIRNGIAVQAVAGDRGRYQPLRSQWTSSTEPAEVLKALRDEFGFCSCYVADLDGIERGKANRCTLGEMVRTGVKLFVDSGVRTSDDAKQLLDIGVERVIVSSESLPNLSTISDLLQACEIESIIFSIDLKHGQLITADPQFRDCSPLDLVAKLIDVQLRNLLVLDLAAVGTGTGIPTLDLCRQIKNCWPSTSLISGGGVHSAACLRSAQAHGIDGLLISSALHDGRLTPEEMTS